MAIFGVKAWSRTNAAAPCVAVIRPVVPRSTRGCSRSRRCATDRELLRLPVELARGRASVIVRLPIDAPAGSYHWKVSVSAPGRELVGSTPQLISPVEAGEGDEFF